MTRCSHCSLPVLNPEPPRCRFCNAIVCSPDLRDCGYAHWRVRHSNRARKVKDIEGPGLDRLTPGEKRAYDEGAWAVES